MGASGVLATFKVPVVAAVMAAAVGCGTTVVTSTDPGARLYAEGRLLGVGRGEMQRRGTPGSTTVTAVAQDGRRAQATASRSFTGFTLLTGLITYGICFIACWEYPDTVMVGLPAPVGGFQPSSGFPPDSGSFGAGAPAGGGGDPWLQPPPGWQGKPAPAPQPAVEPATPPHR